MPRFQVEGGKRIDFRRAYPRAAFDRQSILWDLNYFKYHFLKLAHIPFNEAHLERDFSRLARHLLAGDRSWFLYRDLQSRNVMVRQGPEGPEPWFIDYQGGRRGALQYDVASLLYDSKANLSDRHREALLDHYIGVIESLGVARREAFLELWPGLRPRAPAAGARAPTATGDSSSESRASCRAYRTRRRTCGGCSREVCPWRCPNSRGRWARSSIGGVARQRRRRSREGLEVTVSSFRYPGGYPADTSGHGGGYVFDCRGLPNPGREEAYRDLTGLDEETVAFIAARPEAQEFWERVRGIVDAHIANYLERGFHSLSVHFGCTGGQHRSVYMAERLRRHLSVRFPGVRVEVTHRESADWPRRPARV